MFDEVLTFWFGSEPEPSKETTRKWFVRDERFDAEIRAKFGELHDRAVRTNMPEWAGKARGELALVILLDQFSRNMFRDSPRAFAQDGRALTVARELWFSGRAKQLARYERMFVLMPFQHSEDFEIQSESVREFGKLVAEFPGDAMLDAAFDFAKRHAAIIERFRRFPHRNRVLGRESTPEERAFLEQPDSTF